MTCDTVAEGRVAGVVDVDVRDTFISGAMALGVDGEIIRCTLISGLPTFGR